MGYLLLESFRWLFNKFIIFVFILALIVGLNSIYKEYVRYTDERDKRDELIANIKQDEIEYEAIKAQLDEEAKQIIEGINIKILGVKNQLQLKKDLLELLPETLSQIPGTEAYYDRLSYTVDIKTLSAQLVIHNTTIKNTNIKNVKILAALSERIDSSKKQLIQIDTAPKTIWDKLFEAVSGQLTNAGMILLGIILVPVGIKTFFFYIVAPLAEKRPAIQLLPNPSDTINICNINKGNISSVSKVIILKKDEELSIRPEFIQDSARYKSKKSTQVFINNRLPFSSISTGLFLLSRITTENGEPITVCATKDPLMEVGVINLPIGSSLVSHPRSLVGVIHKTAQQINITKHWRLFSLQAWLTLQLRFLVIHGPCNLIVNGCRGVRIEEAREARMINQSATLGFSANLNYNNTRSETFIPYLKGQEDLFNDVFHGEKGIYVYAEIPDQRRKAGITGRGLEGFVDTMLKVFGL